MEFDPVVQKDPPSNLSKDDFLPVDPHHPQTHDGHDLTEPLTDPSKSKYSDVLTVLAAGAALVSDGYQNNAQNVGRQAHLMKLGGLADFHARFLNALPSNAIDDQFPLRQAIRSFHLHFLSVYSNLKRSHRRDYPRSSGSGSHM